MTPPGQLRALVALRFRMVRSPRQRLLLAALLALVPVMAAWFVLVGRVAPTLYQNDVRVILPTLFAAYAVLCVMAPLAAGGATEVFPSEQLVAMPIKPRTVFLGGLLLTPLNVAWLAQTWVLLGALSYATARTGADATAIVAGMLWAAACTTVGSVLAWTIVGFRQDRAGRIATWVVGGALATAAALTVAAGRLVEVLDSLPTIGIATRAILLPGQQYYRFVAWLALVPVLALLVGPRVCAWALRRGVDRAGAKEATAYPRRDAVGVSSLLHRTDRASVWRSPALRRGVLLLAALPAGIALLADMTWTGLVLVPGLVAAGAGLLFGVNAFSLDGSGAVWLATLPHDASVALRAKARVLAEACALPTAIAVVTGVAAADRLPRPEELTAVLTVAVTSVVVVVTRCLRLSVTRPHRADLRGPRDTPAPPGTMALYSADLAARTTALAMYLSLAPLTRLWWAAPVLAAPVLLACGASVAGSWRRWAEPERRGRVVVTVAYG